MAVGMGWDGEGLEAFRSRNRTHSNSATFTWQILSNAMKSQVVPGPFVPGELLEGGKV